MPLPLILAALASAGAAAGGAGALTGLGAAGGMAGQGALASLAGQGGFLSGAPFGAAGFMGNSASSALPGLMSQTGVTMPMNKNSIMQALGKDLANMRGGGISMPFIKRDQPNTYLVNQRSRSSG